MSLSLLVAQFLAEKLSPEAFQRIQEHSQNGPVFEYHPAEQTFELVEELGWQDDLNQDELNLLLYCCHLLTQEAGEKIKQELGQSANLQQEQSFYYTFPENLAGATRNDSAVALAFIRMLKRETGFRYRVEELLGEVRVEVTITFRSEQEYQQKKDELEWLIQLARRKADESPLRGSRLF